jgi:FkbM family methyltransferase
MVTADIYGFPLRMRIDHRLPEILAYVPAFNQPLGILAETLTGQGRQISVIDVGANIGDTVALIEQWSRSQADYLCVEPDQEFFELCTRNLRSFPRARVVREFIGDLENAGATLVEHLPGTAATRIVSSGGERMVPLDSLARSFVARHGLDLIKVDTDGFDFAVLRSAAGLLDRYHPAVYFEWFPDLWLKAGEDPAAVFGFLASHGYQNLAFFTNQGQFFCASGLLDWHLLEGLRDLSLARTTSDGFHFDVLAAEEAICRSVVRKSLCLLPKSCMTMTSSTVSGMVESGAILSS